MENNRKNNKYFKYHKYGHNDSNYYKNRRYYRKNNNKNVLLQKNEDKEEKSLDKILSNKQDDIKLDFINDKKTSDVSKNDNNSIKESHISIEKPNEEEYNVPKMPLFKMALGIIILIALIFGVSYAYFNYYHVDSRQADIAGGEAYVRVDPSQKVDLTLSKLYPRTNEEARSRNDNYIDFKVEGINTSQTKVLYYSIDITNGENIQNKVRISPQYIKVDLQEKINGEYTYIKNAISLNEFDFDGIVPVNTTTKIEREFRLRVWISDNIIISDTEENATFTQSEFANLYANFHVSVNAVDEKKVPVYFDANGGSVAQTSKIYEAGDTYGELPVPTRAGYKFVGWENDDTKVMINADTIVSTKVMINADTIDSTNAFQHLGDYYFDGTNYLDTSIKLFNEETANKNFYISFEIKERASSQTTQAVLMGANDEAISGNPGMFFRIGTGSSTGKYQLAARAPDKTVDKNFSEVQKVEIIRINGIVSYRYNGEGSFTMLQDMSSFNKYHNLTVTFGAGIKNNAIFRGFKGTLSNMMVAFLDNEATDTDYDEHYDIKTTVTLKAKWSEYIIFDKLTSYDIEKVSYIQNYDSIIAANSGFSTQDTVNTNANKKTVYYYTGAEALEHGNVLFGGFCWQIIRTTDTGSIKMIYNGIAENDKCKTDRDYSQTRGINLISSNNTTMEGTKLYGRSYDYNLETGIFTIKDTDGLPTVWSENDTNNNGIVDHRDLMGTYTCLNTSNTCSDLYYIGHQVNSTQAKTGKYNVGLVAGYSQVGTSLFNTSSNSLAYFGYMFNTNYKYLEDLKEGTYYTDVSNYTNGVYTLTGAGETSPDNNHHYVCDDNDCREVRYYYYAKDTYYRYILLQNGETIESALKKMINNEGDVTVDINVYNSAMKGYLDNWYAKNLINFTNYLDTETVYCNDRRTTTIAGVNQIWGWDKSGDLTNGDTIRFRQYSQNKDLSCGNVTDRFSVNNNKAKLIYPIGLLTEPERGLMSNNYAVTGQDYLGLTPRSYNRSDAFVFRVTTSGGVSNDYVYSAYGVRPVVSLKPDVTVISGDGGYETPYEINTSS